MFDVRRVPGVLLEDDLSDQPAELVQWLRDAQLSLQLDADALAEIPLSLDHPDVNSSNAIMLDDGRAILLDWEEEPSAVHFSASTVFSTRHTKSLR